MKEHPGRDPIVVLAADEGFAMPLAVTVRSMLENLGPDRQLQLYVLDGGILPETKERMVRSWPQPARYQLQWVPVDESNLDGIEASGHVTVAAYYRILMPRLLPSNVRRVIYLDSDLLVVNDIGALWDCELGESLCLAGQDFFAPYLESSLVLPHFDRIRHHIANRPIPNYRALGLTPEMPYFNSGVMLIDMEAWRELNVEAQLLHCLREHKEHVHLWDQYALNVVLARRWGKLDLRWNQGSHIYRVPSWRFSHLDRSTFRAALKAPSIVHFSSPEKPWHANSSHPWRKEFFRYLDRTAWSGWRPGDDTSWSGKINSQIERLRTAKRNYELRIKARWQDFRSRFGVGEKV